MKRIYISGPMTGKPDLNFPAFNAEAARLRALGYVVVNPAEINQVTQGDWKTCLRRDIVELMSCDTIALMPGWMNSDGAHLEMHIAHRVGLRIVLSSSIVEPCTVEGTIVRDEFEIEHVDDLHPDTMLLVRQFAYAMAEKLRRAEQKYGYSDGWKSPDWMNECRAELRAHLDKGDPLDVANFCAFLWHHGESTAGAKVFDLVAHLYRQREFSQRTFGPGTRLRGVLNHIRKELVEVEADPDDVYEWADLVLLSLDGAWRHGHTPEEIAAAIEAKQTKNEDRQWPDWRQHGEDEPIHHVKEIAA